jgi:hypothetical protein
MKDTIDMAREVDPVTKLLLDKKLPQGMDHDVFMWFLERFADLVRADEREACAKVCDAFQSRDVGMQPAECAGAIRARGNT